MIKNIFSVLYVRVEFKYYDIGIFGINKVKKLKKNFRERNFTKSSKEKVFNEYLMYYAMDEKKNIVNFILFDFFLNHIQFSSEDINEMKKDFPSEREAYEKFITK